jgi:hypothetical protein
VCRSIKTLRPPYAADVSPQDVHDAALQYVRKVAGMRHPAAVNQVAFDRAVQDIATVTQTLLDGLVLRSPRPAAAAR